MHHFTTTMQEGNTALIHACKRGNLQSTQLLLKAKANPNHLTNVSNKLCI